MLPRNFRHSEQREGGTSALHSHHAFKKRIGLFSFALISVFLNISAKMEHQLTITPLKRALYDAVQRSCGSERGVALEHSRKVPRNFSQIPIKKFARQKDFSSEAFARGRISNTIDICGLWCKIYVVCFVLKLTKSCLCRNTFWPWKCGSTAFVLRRQRKC